MYNCLIKFTVKMPLYSKELYLLIIEDNPGDFILVEDYLREEHAKCIITHALSLKQAKAYLSKENTFDAILLDLTLPDGSGEPLVTEALQLAGNSPVIVLTGYTDKEFGVKTLSLGVSDYLLKDELTASHLYKSILYSIERNRINARLNESEEYYRNMFHLNPLPMWVFDIETYQFLNVNEAAVKHYGYSKEEFLSMTIMDIRPQEEVPAIEYAVNTTADKDKYYQSPVWHRKKNGTLIQVEVQSNIIRFDERKARLVLANDITERNNYLREIEEQNKRLQEIAWIQSHVVRAPLARIMGLIDLIKTHPSETLDNDELLNYIITSAKELDEVIRTIVAKTEQVEKQQRL